MTATYNNAILEHKKTGLTAKELDEFYKRNLVELVNCRSLEDVIKSKKINQQFVRYAIDILSGITDKHLVLFESDERMDFLLVDVYPIGLRALTNYFGAMSLTSLLFPISYNRAIALVDTDSKFRIKHFKVKNKDWYEKPKKFGEGYLIQKKDLSEDLVIRMNEAIFKGSIDGVCFRSGRRTGLSELE